MIISRSAGDGTWRLYSIFVANVNIYPEGLRGFFSFAVLLFFLNIRSKKRVDFNLIVGYVITLASFDWQIHNNILRGFMALSELSLLHSVNEAPVEGVSDPQSQSSTWFGRAMSYCTPDRNVYPIVAVTTGSVYLLSFGILFCGIIWKDSMSDPTRIIVGTVSTAGIVLGVTSYLVNEVIHYYLKSRSNANRASQSLV